MAVHTKYVSANKMNYMKVAKNPTSNMEDADILCTYKNSDSIFSDISSLMVTTDPISGENTGFVDSTTAAIGFSRPFNHEGTSFSEDIIPNKPLKVFFSFYLGGNTGTSEDNVYSEKVDGELPVLYEMTPLGPKNHHVTSCYDCGSHDNVNYMCSDEDWVHENPWSVACCPSDLPEEE